MRSGTNQVVGACEVDTDSHIFLSRPIQHIQEINGHFGGTLSSFCPMVFASNKSIMNPAYLRICCCNQTSYISFYTLLNKLKHMKPEIIEQL